MYAIIEDSGTQLKVAEGDVVEIDPRDVDDDRVRFDRVLLVADGEADEPRIGTPYLDGAAVTARVLDRVTGRKIQVIKFKRRKGYRRTRGHRQRYLLVQIDGIEQGG